MNHTLKLKLCLTALCAVSLFSACQLEPLNDDMRTEMFTRNFIKEFGLIDPEQDWNMAQEAVVKINVGEVPANKVKMYAKYGSEYYLVADLDDISGSVEVPVDVPEGCQEVMVEANSARYFGRVGEQIDCSDHPVSRGNVVSRTTSVDSVGKNYQYDPNNPWYTKEIAGVTIQVMNPAEDTNPLIKEDRKDKDYLYFNAQQMAPILQPDEWSNYWSMSWASGKYQENDGNYIGNLPEIGTANKKYQEGNAYKHQSSVKQDFVFQMQNPKVGFDIYPMFYGSNLRHTLGVYLLDDNKEAICGSDGKPIKYPIYQSKHGDDIVVKTDQYVKEKDLIGEDKYIRVYIDDEKVKRGDNQGYPLTMAVGEEVEIRFVYKENIQEATFPSNLKVKRTDSEDVTIKASNNTIMNNGTEVTGINTFTLSPNKDGYSKWIKFEISGDVYGSEGKREYAFVCDFTKGTKVKSYEIWNGSTKITDPTNSGILVPLGESKDLVVKCVDANGNYVTNEQNLRAGNWHRSIFKLNDSDNATLNLYYDNNAGGYKLKVTGISATATSEWTEPGIQWAGIFVDLDNSNGANGNEPAVSLRVVVRDVETHSYTETINLNYDNSASAWPLSSPNTWQSYFYTQAEIDALGSGSGAPKRNAKPRSRAAESTLWEGTQAFGSDWTVVNLTNLNSCTVNSGDVVKAYITPGDGSSQCHLSVNEDAPGNNFTYINGASANGYNLTVTSVQGPITQEQANNLFTYGIQVRGQNFTLTKIVVISPDPELGDWHNGAKAQMKTDLETYYRNSYSPTYTCKDGDGYQLVAGAYGVEKTVTVTVTGENQDNAQAVVKVTLKKEETPSLKPTKKLPKSVTNMQKAKRATKKSRAEQTWAELTSSNPEGALYHNNSTTFYPIRMNYIDAVGKTDSYDYDKPLLVKSRGYRVYLTDSEGNPWTGYFGMYIDYDWGIPDVNSGVDGSVNSNWTAGGEGRPEKGTHYSQSKWNKLIYDGNTYEISYAAIFTHPKSTNEYLCFEDWDVTLPSGDVSTTGNTASYSYGGTFNWGGVFGGDDQGNNKRGYYSSDRDLNDIIYRQVGLVAVRTSEIDTNNKGFDWIWALEDLGSTDDFDFNDVVIRINSITKSITQDGKTTFVKNITFTPLAAGGTLPVYIHYKYDDTHDFVLKPSTKASGEFVPYDLSTDEMRAVGGRASGGLSQTEGLEFHRWFGGYGNTTMINTGAGTSVSKEWLENNAVCHILIPSNHSLNAPHKSIPQAVANGMYTVDANGFGFYVTINGPTAVTAQEDINENGDRLNKTNDTYLVGLPVRGAAAQSFLIVATSYKFDTNNGTTNTENQTYAHPWYWPSERSHILQAYPDFNQWITDKSNNTWWTNCNQSYVYKLQ